MLNIPHSEHDLPRDVAVRAYYGTSMTPKTHADADIRQYIDHIDFVVRTFSPFVTPENVATLTADLVAYQQQYIKHLIAYWHTRSRCLSVLIAGPSNFDVRRADRANAAEAKAIAAFKKWSNAAFSKLVTHYNPHIQKPIYSDDPDAVTQLREKLSRLKHAQQRMKDANLICRSSKLTDAEKRTQLAALNYAASYIYALLRPEYGKPGHPPYMLTNNNANIRSIEARITALEAEQSSPVSPDRDTAILGEPVTVSENTTLTRLQLYFTDKPSQPVRDLLKQHGFRYSPTHTCWQRLLNNSARFALSSMESRQ